MAITAGELRKGLAVRVERDVWVVLEYTHLKVGRGGAVAKVRIRNVRTGATVERTWSAAERFETAEVEHRPGQYLYRDGDRLHFMDTTSYEQHELASEALGNAVDYLVENTAVELELVDGNATSVTLPPSVTLRVTETEPGRDSGTGGKPAVLETSLRVQVPPFVQVGDSIRVDTRNGTYLERLSSRAES